jgi:hypothetical protein
VIKKSLLIQINPLIKLSHWFKFNQKNQFKLKQFLNKKHKTSLVITLNWPSLRIRPATCLRSSTPGQPGHIQPSPGITSLARSIMVRSSIRPLSAQMLVRTTKLPIGHGPSKHRDFLGCVGQHDHHEPFIVI